MYLFLTPMSLGEDVSVMESGIVTDYIYFFLWQRNNGVVLHCHRHDYTMLTMLFSA
jgi:hypothetical protein